MNSGNQVPGMLKGTRAPSLAAPSAPAAGRFRHVDQIPPRIAVAYQ
jgi:hypothetical protein